MESVNWPVVTGCFRISEGCNSCPSYWEYLEEGKDYSPKVDCDALPIPYNADGPLVFNVAFGSDLFHFDVPIDFIKTVFSIMNDNPQHTFVVLTKRIGRAEMLSGSLKFTGNIQMGTVVESEEYADRIAVLRRIDAKVRIVSMAPVLGPMGKLDLRGIDSVGAVRETWGYKRPAKKEWIEDVARQCGEQGVQFTGEYSIYKEGEEVWQEPQQ